MNIACLYSCESLRFNTKSRHIHKLNWVSTRTIRKPSREIYIYIHISEDAELLLREPWSWRGKVECLGVYSCRVVSFREYPNINYWDEIDFNFSSNRCTSHFTLLYESKLLSFFPGGFDTNCNCFYQRKHMWNFRAMLPRCLSLVPFQ